MSRARQICRADPGGRSIPRRTLLMSAIAGLAACALPRSLRSGVSTVLYLMLGWCGIVAFEPLFAALSNSALILLATGGVL